MGSRRSVFAAACAAVLCGCAGSGSNSESADDSNGGANSSPSLLGTPATFVWQGDPYRFAPQATDADGDALLFEVENLPAWASFDTATGRVSGVPGETDVGDTFGIRVGVSDGQHTVWLPPFDLTVLEVSHGAVLVTWEPPTENIDETPLEDLTGFKIYWGPDPDAPSGTVAVTGAGTTAYQFSGLAPGRYYFALTAVNVLGLESEFSDRTAMVVR